jgi:hypothetical protein
VLSQAQSSKHPKEYSKRFSLKRTVHASGVASAVVARMRRPGLAAVGVAFMALPAGASGAGTGGVLA